MLIVVLENANCSFTNECYTFLFEPLEKRNTSLKMRNTSCSFE